MFSICIDHISIILKTHTDSRQEHIAGEQLQERTCQILSQKVNCFLLSLLGYAENFLATEQCTKCIISANMDPHLYESLISI